VVGGGKRTLDYFFPTKKAQDARWEVVPSPHRINVSVCEVRLCSCSTNIVIDATAPQMQKRCHFNHSIIAPAGHLYARKKIAGSVSLEHSTIKMVEMMYS
jgi:hypothetical protein